MHPRRPPVFDVIRENETCTRNSSGGRSSTHNKQQEQKCSVGEKEKKNADGPRVHEPMSHGGVPVTPILESDSGGRARVGVPFDNLFFSQDLE